MVNVPVTVLPPEDAEIVAVIAAVTELVVTVKVAVLAPAAIITLLGTFALDVLEVRVTVVPPAGAAVGLVTVPVALVPPTTVVGDSVTEVSVDWFRTLLTRPEKII